MRSLLFSMSPGRLFKLMKKSSLTNSCKPVSSSFAVTDEDTCNDGKQCTKEIFFSFKLKIPLASEQCLTSN